MRLHIRILPGLLGKVIARLLKRHPCQSTDVLDSTFGEVRVPVESGTCGGAAQSNLRQLIRAVLDARDALLHLRCVSPKLLPQTNRRSVHEVRAPALEHIVERLGFFYERGVQRLHGWHQIVEHGGAGGHMHGGGNDIVRRLRHVHVVVGMHGFAAPL